MFILPLELVFSFLFPSPYPSHFAKILFQNYCTKLKKLIILESLKIPKTEHLFRSDGVRIFAQCKVCLRGATSRAVALDFQRMLICKFSFLYSLG